MAVDGLGNFRCVLLKSVWLGRPSLKPRYLVPAAAAFPAG
jgi:hypothetical protein